MCCRSSLCYFLTFYRQSNKGIIQEKYSVQSQKFTFCLDSYTLTPLKFTWASLLTAAALLRPQISFSWTVFVTFTEVECEHVTQFQVFHKLGDDVLSSESIHGGGVCVCVCEVILAHRSPVAPVVWTLEDVRVDSVFTSQAADKCLHSSRYNRI